MTRVQQKIFFSWMFFALGIAVFAVWGVVRMRAVPTSMLYLLDGPLFGFGLLLRVGLPDQEVPRPRDQWMVLVVGVSAIIVVVAFQNMTQFVVLALGVGVMVLALVRLPGAIAHDVRMFRAESLRE